MLSICRDHGQPPSWWNTLDKEDRARLLAWQTYQAIEAKKRDR